MTDHPPGWERQEGGKRDPTGASFPADISQLIVATSEDGIVAVDNQGIIRLCNRAAEDLLERPASELIGAPFGLPVASEKGAEVELMLPGGGERIAAMRATTTVEGERLHIVALRDLSVRRRAEHDLEAALERQNIVVGIAAHQLHNPLAAISMLAHVLRDRQAAMTPEDRTQIIDRIIEQTTDLQLLVRKLLTASKIDAAGARALPQRVPVLEAIVEQLASFGESSGEVRVSCSPDLVAVADRAEVSMMLANYLDNALKYALPPIEIEAAGREGQAEIRVADRGPGVPAPFVPHLFDRFSRVPETGHKAEGTGLGLWIVRTFARANRGEAWYEPREGGGSCFCLRLPLAR